MLYVLEVECIGKGKVCKLYEFGVKIGLFIIYCYGLIVGVRIFLGNLYDGYILFE